MLMSQLSLDHNIKLHMARDLLDFAWPMVDTNPLYHTINHSLVPYSYLSESFTSGDLVMDSGRTSGYGAMGFSTVHDPQTCS